MGQDGTGQLSPFTDAFVRSVGTSGYSIQRVMSDVNRSVGEATDWRQTPWMKSSLTGELKLGGGQTLAEAQSVSDNHAARAAGLLDTDGKKQAAFVEALKGLPATDLNADKVTEVDEPVGSSWGSSPKATKSACSATTARCAAW